MKTKWFEVKNQTNMTSDLYFYGDIVSSDWNKWEDEDKTATDVRNFLNSIDQNTKLNIYINSAGGVVTTGVAIYNLLKRHKGYKTAYIDGIAASISSIIPFAADKIIMPKTSYMMVHLPLVGVYGNKNELQQAMNVLETIESNMMDVYYSNLKNEEDKERIKNFVYNETWLTGEEATALFNIELIDGVEAVACASKLYSNYSKVPKSLMEAPFKPGDLTVNVQDVLQKRNDEKIKFENELVLLDL